MDGLLNKRSEGLKVGGLKLNCVLTRMKLIDTGRSVEAYLVSWQPFDWK